MCLHDKYYFGLLVAAHPSEASSKLQLNLTPVIVRIESITLKE
jgi:hypothetical protein